MSERDRSSSVSTRFVGLNAGQELGRVVTRRPTSLFAADVAEHSSELFNRIQGKRILVVGGGGTIGSATTQVLCQFKPSAICVVDISENYLVELVRSLRGQASGLEEIELQTYAMDYGGPIMSRMLSSVEPFDIVLNFAALKHVRSEKDVYSLLQMIDTNVVAHARFKQNLASHGHGSRYFAVSTDKAANPSSLMGASKRLMEDVAFDIAAENASSTTSTRFANVAFSNGSLLQGFLQRLAKGQPIAAPKDTRRYFVTEEEAGELCLIAAFLAPDRHVVFPRLQAERELQFMQDVATRVIEAFGYSPVIYSDEEAARHDVASLRAKGRWPLLLTALDTSGEKPFEEFLGSDEQEEPFGLTAVSALRHSASGRELQSLLASLARLIQGGAGDVAKEDVVASIRSAIPTFSHKETGRSLDDRM